MVSLASVIPIWNRPRMSKYSKQYAWVPLWQTKRNITFCCVLSSETPLDTIKGLNFVSQSYWHWQKDCIDYKWYRNEFSCRFLRNVRAWTPTLLLRNHCKSRKKTSVCQKETDWRFSFSCHVNCAPTWRAFLWFFLIQFWSGIRR